MISSKSITEAAVSKKVVISGYYGFKNFGDELILSVLTQQLKGCDITVLSSDPDWSRKTYNIDAVYSFDLKSVFKTIKKADILISGGGSLLQDVTSLKSLIYYSLIIFMALLLRKKVIIFAQGIGPINNPVAQKIVFFLLKRAAFVSVRDEKSHALLAKNGVPSELVCDPAFTLNLPDVSKEQAVGIQLRSFKTMSEDFIDRLAEYTAKYFSDKKIVVLPLQTALDREVCTKFLDSIKKYAPDAQAEMLSQQDNSVIINQISRLEYLIAMRFHALVIGMKAGVKCLGINYDQKVEKLAEDAGIPLLSLSDTSDFDKKFADLQAENASDLKNFANSKSFNWQIYDLAD